MSWAGRPSSAWYRWARGSMAELAGPGVSPVGCGKSVSKSTCPEPSCSIAERADAFHVFCHAPTEALVARAAQRLAADEETARAQVERVNRRREQYVRTHFDRDWRDVANYHLSLDTAAFGIEGAADLVVAAVRLRFGLATAP